MSKLTRKHHEISCWIVTEGIAGTENQCVGVAEALKISPIIKRISLNEPWRTLSPYIGWELDLSFTPRLIPPWPDLLIASGRKSIAAARYIKKKSQGKTIIVQIQDPRFYANQFDLIAVPEHDPSRGSNIVITKASPNKITKEKINNAKSEFPELGNLPTPRVAVLIGGKSKAYNITSSITEKLARDLVDLKVPLMITCSRRTGIENQRILETHLKKDTNYFWNGEGKNPYMAMLGWADYILVTADSASMISESCTTGKPVYMIELHGEGSKRIDNLHRNLIRHGALKKFTGKLEKFTYEPLNDSLLVANEVKKRFGSLLGLADS